MVIERTAEGYVVICQDNSDRDHWLTTIELKAVLLALAIGLSKNYIVLDDLALVDEPRWESGSILTLGKAIRLIVEVVITNWQDNYLSKLRDYEALGIQEYWIVDYAALGGRQFIGKPKQPTFSVYSLIDREYDVQRFREGDSILSPTFPELNLTVDQVFAVGH